jgi:hypothetical protein
MKIKKLLALLLFFCIPYSVVALPAEIKSPGYLKSGLNVAVNVAIAGQQAFALGSSYQHENFGTNPRAYLIGDCEVASQAMNSKISSVAKQYGINSAIPVYQLKNPHALKTTVGIVSTNGAGYVSGYGLINFNQDSALADFFLHDAILQIQQSLYSKRILNSIGLGCISYSVCTRLIDTGIYGPLSYLGFDPLSSSASWAAFGAHIPLMLACGVAASIATSVVVNGAWSTYAQYALTQRLKRMKISNRDDVRRELAQLRATLHENDQRAFLLERYLGAL